MDAIVRLQEQVAALLDDNARLTALLAERDAKIQRLEARAERAESALLNIIGVLGPAACRCEGQQEEVDTALGYARATLAAASEGMGVDDGQ